MGRYRSKPREIIAYCWTPGLNLPGIEEVEMQEPAFTMARRLGRFTTIHGQETYVAEGTFVIQEPDGLHWYPCDPNIFAERYELLATEV